MHTYICVCMYICIYNITTICTHIFTYIQYIYIYIYAFTFIYYLHTVHTPNICTRKQIHTAGPKRQDAVYTSALRGTAPTHTHTYIHLYIYIYTHTHIYVYIQPDPRDKMQCTPLHYAALQGNIRIIQALVAAKADVNSKDANEYVYMYVCVYVCMYVYM